MSMMPDNLKHLGFVIANADQEFLHSWKHRPGYLLKGWTLSPALAHVFETRQMASNVITLLDHYSKLWILDLFDSPGSFVVASDRTPRPQWLKENIPSALRSLEAAGSGGGTTNGPASR